MSQGTLFDKVWDAHRVGTLSDGRDQLFIGLHLIHEVTSPQAFAQLHERDIDVAYPNRTFATVDHIVPTTAAGQVRPLADPLAEEMIAHLEANVARHGIRYFGPDSGQQGIVHVIGPELGLTQPGMTICCGDSHTSTHGALGAIAFGVGTSQVRDILATQTIAMSRLNVRRVEVNGVLGAGVYAKDVALHIIKTLGVQGGVGFAYEFAGSAIESLSVEGRMTLCNMAIEGGARIGYVNPDATTFAYLKGRDFAPAGEAWERAVSWWRSLRSDPDADYDDVVRIPAEDIGPTVTWGTHPGQAIGISERIPATESVPVGQRDDHAQALSYMDLKGGEPIVGTPVDVAFIGSCTNSRLEDIREVAHAIDGTGHRVHAGVKALVVPGSDAVKAAAEAEGLHEILVSAGFEWREPGCSMCLAMNPDRLIGRQLCASSSNRNFRGRQGSPTGRTVLMSPVMVAAAAIRGQLADAREVFGPAVGRGVETGQQEQS